MDDISPGFIELIGKRLGEGKRVRRFLPGDGILHIDRPLPFLCIYRYPKQFKDTTTARLVKTEASYLIASADQSDRLKPLILKIAQIMSDKFGAFLIFEVWSSAPSSQTDPAEAAKTPAFEIFGPGKKLPATIKTFCKAISDMKGLPILKSVAISSEKQRHPEGMPVLLNEEEIKAVEILLLGLKLQPFYINPENSRPYPFLFRTLRTELAKVFKKTVFDFIRIQTSNKFTNFQMLGRKSVVKAVWKVDQQLVNISSKFKFLLLVSPINTEEAWQSFCDQHFDKTPIFRYRLIPVDTEELKRELYNIPVEIVEDPTLSYLFRDKRYELDKMLTMLQDRGTDNFLYSSLQLFGPVEEDLVKLAEGIMAAYPACDNEKSEYLSAEEFAQKAREEIQFLHAQCDIVDACVEIRKDITGLMVSEGNLLIGTEAKIAKDRADALIQHEVGTHILTYFNGKAQPLQQLYSGVPGYEELQEGLAVLSEYLVGGLTKGRLRTLAARVLAINAMVKGATFIETFRLLKEKYNFSPHAAFNVTTRVFRSGGLTKDAVYLKGLVHLLDYLKEGHDLEPLLIGKIRQDYIPIMQELIYRNVLKPMPIKPRYLNDSKALEKIQQLKKGMKVFQLIDNI